MKKVLFKVWAKEWLDDKRHYVKESSYANYRTIIINHLIPTFGGCDIKEISCEKIQNAVLIWAQEGRIDCRGGLSTKSIRDIVMVLKMCLRDADMDERQMSSRSRIIYPDRKDEARKLQVLEEKSYQSFINTVLKNLDSESLGFLLCLYTGMRIGEICALQWKDIDIESRVINVNKTIQRIYEKGWDKKGTTRVLITTPKSKHSVRVIPISDSIFELIKKQRKGTEMYVVTGGEKYIEPRLYRKHYGDFIKNNSLEFVKFHGLRHTFATRCIEAGADYKTVSELLGHSSVNLTLNLYVHPRLEEKRRCINLL